MPGIEEAVNYQDIWDYGARGDGNSNDAWAINAAIAAGVARNGNGARILIRPTANFYNLETPIVLQDDVEILICGGAQLKVAYGLDIDAITGTSVSRCRIHGSGTLIGTYDFTKSYHGIHLITSYLCSIEGIHIAGMARTGIFIDGGSDNRLHNVVCASNGRSGMLIDNSTTRNHLDSVTCYNNGQGAGTGDGIHLDHTTTRTTIVNAHCFDGVGPFPTAQLYPIREVAASGCDYTTIVGLQAVGNVTSQLPSLVGTHSALLDGLSSINTQLTTPTIVGRITANTVGASAKPLLNFVPLAAPSTTNSQGTGSVGVNTTIAGLPASAVAVSVNVVISRVSGGNFTVGDRFVCANPNIAGAEIDMFAAVAAQNRISGSGVITVAAGASNQVTATGIVSDGTLVWNMAIVPIGYWEPA